MRDESGTKFACLAAVLLLASLATLSGVPSVVGHGAHDDLVVSAFATPTAGTPPLTVSFTATASGAPPYTYDWNFGDGATSTEQNPTHTYQNAGTYNVWVTVTDVNGESGIDNVQIVVTAA